MNDLEALYADRYAHFVGLAEWLVGDRRLAEELVQETFVRLVENPPTLNNPSALEAYLRAALMNRCRSKIRRMILERRHARAWRDEGTSDIHSDAELRQAIAALPTRQRQCIVLRFYEDLTIDQIADAISISSGSVKTHLHRALRALDEAIARGTDE